MPHLKVRWLITIGYLRGNLNWDDNSTFFAFSGPSSESLELQSLSYDSSCTDTSCVNDELEGSSDQYTESGISVNSD